MSWRWKIWRSFLVFPLDYVICLLLFSCSISLSWTANSLSHQWEKQLVHLDVQPRPYTTGTGPTDAHQWHHRLIMVGLVCHGPKRQTSAAPWQTADEDCVIDNKCKLLCQLLSPRIKGNPWLQDWSHRLNQYIFWQGKKIKMKLTSHLTFCKMWPITLPQHQHSSLESLC